MAELADRVRMLWQKGDSAGVLDALPTGWEQGVRHLGDRAMLHFWRADALFKLGRYIEAAPGYKAAYELIQHVESGDDAVWLLLGYATKQGKSWDHVAAIRLAATARDRARPATVQRAYATWIQAWWTFKSGEHVQGIRLLEVAIEEMAAAGAHSEIVCVVLDLIECHLDKGDAEAAAYLLHTHEAAVSGRSLRLRSRYQNLRARAFYDLGDMQAAFQAAAQAFAQAKAAGDTEQCAAATSLVAQVADSLGGNDRRLAEFALAHSISAQRGALVRSALARCHAREASI